MTDKQKNKFFSRRWIVTVWTLVLITLIVILGTLFDNSSFSGLAMTLSGVPIAFTSLETVNKWKQSNNDAVEGSVGAEK